MNESNLIIDILTYLTIDMFISAPLTAVITLLLNLFVMPFTRRKTLSNARKAGNMIDAKLVKMNWTKGEVGFNLTYWGYYEYEYNGKKYKYTGRFSNIPPRTLILYFKKNPAKAVTEDWFGYVQDEWKPIFLVLTIILFIIVAIYLG